MDPDTSDKAVITDAHEIGRVQCWDNGEGGGDDGLDVSSADDGPCDDGLDVMTGNHVLPELPRSVLVHQLLQLTTVTRSSQDIVLAAGYKTDIVLLYFSSFPFLWLKWRH